MEIRGSGVSICKRSFDQTINIKENKQKLSFYCYFTIFIFSSFFYLGFFSKPLFSPESLKYCVVDYVSGLLVIGVMELKCFAIFNF